MTISQRSILVAEDSRTQAEALRALLDEAGYHVVVARSGEEAIAALRENPVDLVLSDVMMPGISGFDLCAMIRKDEHLRHIPIILLTGLHDAAEAINGLACGASNYVTKPYEPQHLLARIAGVFEKQPPLPGNGVKVRFMDRDFTVAPEPQRILGFLLSGFEELVRANDALRASEVERRRLFELERAARLEAESANRAKADFLAAMSHDLRTPLNAISGYSELLEAGVGGVLPPDALEYVGRIYRSQRHLLSIVNDILNFARLEAGSITLDVIDVPAAPLLRELEELIAPQLAAKQITYVFEPSPQPLTFHTDVEKFRQVMINLLSNAIKFTDAGGAITLSCRSGNGMAIAEVRDTGRGIPAEKLKLIFDPFVQLSSAAGREGVGLGLAISRTLAQQMGGDITAESEVGRGSVFSVTVPLSGVVRLTPVRPGAIVQQ